jgi:hypothetical protein
MYPTIIQFETRRRTAEGELRRRSEVASERRYRAHDARLAGRARRLGTLRAAPAS